MISDSTNNTVREHILRNSRNIIYNSTELQEYHESLKICYLKMRWNMDEYILNYIKKITYK